MTGIKSFFSYWGSGIWRALIDTLTAVDWKPWGILFLVLVEVFTLTHAHKTEGRDAMNTLAKGTVNTLKLSLAAFAVLFVFHLLFVTPFRRFAEQQALAKAATPQVPNAATGLAAVEAAELVTLRENKKQLETQIENLKARLDDRAANAALRNAVVSLSEQGSKVMRALDNKNPSAIADQKNWVKQTLSELRRLNLRDCADEFQNPARGPGWTTPGYSPEVIAAFKDSEERIQALRNCQARLGR
jgi:hypothetical protein